ncbi:hypothetical protein EUGRSUZ_B03000 [Eucalyptus grandis]|uniref:Uncharacterized protein n=2 Tax=Eucalyptus grandis TaxID=71139 RepID=A0ACC3LUX7_EUCGR|nr:hypothetical protein EUGRSUZ_B03000 [Eucalyptus grandis]
MMNKKMIGSRCRHRRRSSFGSLSSELSFAIRTPPPAAAPSSRARRDAEEEVEIPDESWRAKRQIKEAVVGSVGSGADREGGDHEGGDRRKETAAASSFLRLLSPEMTESVDGSLGFFFFFAPVLGEL